MDRLNTDPACATQPPTLTLNGSAEMTFECGPGTYSDPGAQALDGCGQPIAMQSYNTGNDSSGPGPLLTHEGVYYISYTTWNNQGAASATRVVTVKDETLPTLTLNGAAFVTHTCNTPWQDPGATATDVCYASVSEAVVRTGEVNAWAEGTYTVTYSVSDASGNSAPPVTRTVEVVDCPW
ncbi:MAG TPA: DUF5011 domain-containing protein [Myxococcaceae bacterium]|jgi:hypothetical protein